MGFGAFYLLQLFQYNRLETLENFLRADSNRSSVVIALPDYKEEGHLTMGIEHFSFWPFELCLCEGIVRRKLLKRAGLRA